MVRGQRTLASYFSPIHAFQTFRNHGAVLFRFDEMPGVCGQIVAVLRVLQQAYGRLRELIGRIRDHTDAVAALFREALSAKGSRHRRHSRCERLEQLDAYARTAANWANKYSVASERSTDVFNVTSEADIRVAREETEFLRRFRTHDHQLRFRVHSGDPRQDLGYEPSQGFHVRFMTKTADEKQCVRFAAVPRVPVMPGLNASPQVRIEAFLQRRQKLPQICCVVLSAYLHPGHLRKRTEFVAQRSEILQPVRYKFSDAGQPVHRPGYALKIEIMFKKETGNVFVFACILRKLRVFKLHNIDVVLIENPV